MATPNLIKLSDWISLPPGLYVRVRKPAYTMYLVVGETREGSLAFVWDRGWDKVGNVCLCKECYPRGSWEWEKVG